MSGGKGPSGQTTTTTVNPVQQAQLPFLLSGWNTASNLAATDPFQYYPGQTLANFDPNLTSGYANLAGGAYSNDQTLRPAGNNLFFNAATGAYNIQNSPVYQNLMQLATGAAAPEQTLNNAASGLYVGNNNPYLGGIYNAASDAATRAYMTATAPQTTAAYESAGRYGSGAMANSISQNEQDLGKTLGNLASNLYGNAYQFERGQQDQAASQLAGIEGNASNILQSGFQSGNQLNNQALALMPSILQAQFTDPLMQIQAGQGLTGLAQQQIDDAMKRFYGTIAAPWQTNQQFLASLGVPVGGSSSTSTPYFTNPLANALGLATGGLSLYNGLGGSSLFGGAGTGVADLAQTGALDSFGFPLAGAITDAGGGGAAGKGLSSALPFVGK